MNLLITGGCGFLGTNLVYHLANNRPEYSITVFDALTYAGSKANLKPLLKKEAVTFVEGDICDPVQVSRAIRYGIDMIVNLAAETHVDRSIMYPADFVRTNVFGVQVLIDLAGKHSIPILHISTDEVYGPAADGQAFTESDRLNPTSPYAASKASADFLLLAASRTYNQEVMIIRPVNNLGPYQYPEKIIPLFVDRLSRGLPVPVYGDGMQKRTWLYSEDFCSAIELAIDNFAGGECFNLTSGNEISNIDLARRLVKIIGCKDDLIKYVDDRPGHDRRYSVDGSKLINHFGWLPRYDFESALQKTVKWYLDNQTWLKSRRNKEYDEFISKQYGEI